MAQPTKTKPRLGRGLSSLISVSNLPVEAEAPPAAAATGGGPAVAANAAPAGAPLEIPIEAISPNPHQPRKTLDTASIAELAASLRSTGIIQPIVVRKVEDGYQLIAGERRWMAARLAGFTTVAAIVRDVDSFTQAQMALIENIQREDLNPLERAQAYRVLLEQLGLTQAELAGRLGEDRSSIANYLRLLDLPEPVRALVRSGQLSLGHAKLLAGVDDVLLQEKLANMVVNQSLSVRNLERMIQQGVDASPETREKPVPSAHVADLEKSLARQLGMRVQVKTGAKKGKGRLVIHYASLDQFDELLAKLGVKTEG